MKQHFTLDPDTVFLNHGSFGACPIPVLQAQSEMRALLERQPVRFFENEAGPLLLEARKAVAQLMGADHDDLAFVPNATTGVNAAINSFALGEGDEILVTDQEYNACSNVVHNVAARTGARAVVVKIPFPLQSDDQVADAIMDAVTPATRLALIDHITSQTGLIYPIERIVSELKSKGVETVVDGAHALGSVPVNVEAIGAAYYTTNAHKWLCAPKVSAILHVRDDMQERTRPTVISHGANAPVDPALTSRFRLEFDWPGTADITPYLATPAAIEFLSGVLDGGLNAVMKHNHELALAGRDLVLDALSIEKPAPDEMLGPMASIPLPDSQSTKALGPFDLDPLKVALWNEHKIEIPVMPWPNHPHRLLRLSAQIYNTIDDYRRLADALPALLAAD